jgi:hypothetical protein
MVFPLQPTKRKIGNGGGLLRGTLLLMTLVALTVVTQLKESVSVTKILSGTMLVSTNTHSDKSPLTENVDMYLKALSSKTNAIVKHQSPIDVPIDDDDDLDNHDEDKAEAVFTTATTTNDVIKDKNQFQHYSVMKYPASITEQKSQPKQNRTLVVVLGNLRGGEPTWRSMCRHLLDPNMADLALVIGEGNPSESSKTKPTLLHKRAKYVWTVPEFDDWADAMEDIPNKPPDWRKRLFGLTNSSNALNIFLGAANKIGGSGALVFMFRFYLSQIIVENNFVSIYDRFVVTRSDHYYLCRHDLSELSNDYLWVPAGSDYYGICDRHFLASNETVLSALDVLPPLVRNPVAYKEQLQLYDFNSESFLLLRWREEGLEPIIRRFNRTLFVAADSNDQTRWKGKEDFIRPLGVHLKYPQEYLDSLDACPMAQLPIALALALISKYLFGTEMIKNNAS